MSVQALYGPCWQRMARLCGVVGLGGVLVLGALWCLHTNVTGVVWAAPPVDDGGDMLNGANVVMIGVSAALNYSMGWQQVNAVQMAVSQTNQAGGLNIGGTHYDVGLVITNSECDVTKGIQAATGLVTASVVAVIGDTCSTASIAMAPVLRDYGVAMVSPSATNPQFTQMGLTNTFRVTPQDASLAHALARYLAGVGLKRTAVLTVSTLIEPQPYSGYFARLFEDTYGDLGGNIVSRQTIAFQHDITPAITAIQGQPVDAIFVSDLYGHIAGEVSRVAFGKSMTPTVAWLNIDDAYIMNYAGIQAAEGDLGGIVGRRTSDMPGYDGFLDDYLEAGFSHQGANPDVFGAYAYDAARIVMDAIERAGTATDRTAIRNAIAATADYEGVAGVYQGFDAVGDVVPQLARVEIARDGQWIPAWLMAEYYPGQGGTLDLEDVLGQATTVDISPSACTQTLVVTYSILADVTSVEIPTLTVIAGHALRVDTSSAIGGRVTTTVRYRDDDVAGVDEATLEFYVWNGTRWVNAQPCGGYTWDLEHNTLQAILCHLSDYALVGETASATYLPVIRKL